MLVAAVDVPVIVALGALSALAYRRTLRERSANWYAVLTGLFVTVAWLNVAAANLLSTPYWLVGTATASLQPALGIPFVLSYPLWFRAAGEATFVLVGRRSDQGGLLWVFRLSDRTDTIEAPWNQAGTVARAVRSRGGESAESDGDGRSDDG